MFTLIEVLLVVQRPLDSLVNEAVRRQNIVVEDSEVCIKSVYPALRLVEEFE